MSMHPDPSEVYRNRDRHEEENTDDEIERRSFFTRWGWPLFGLAAIVIFEMTASLVWSSLVFALRFGWRDTYAGYRFWWRDGERSRGLALALLHFSAAMSKVFMVSFASFMVLGIASLLKGGPQQAQKPSVVAMTMFLACLGGMLASGFFGVAASLVFHRSGRKMWVDRISYQQAIESDWPPQRFSINRTPRLCFLTMIPISVVLILLTICLPLLWFVDPLKNKPHQWQFVVVTLSSIACVIFFMCGTHWLKRTVTAYTPLECWPELVDLPPEEIDEILKSSQRPDEELGIHRMVDNEAVRANGRRP